MGFLIASLCVVLSLVLGARGQQCTQLQLNQNIEALVVNAITLGDSGSAPAIGVLDIQTVCLAAGSTRDLYRYASVVVSFTCSGSLPPGNPLGISICSGELTVQFDFECVSGPEWANALTLGGDNVFNPADANLSTSLRTDCSFCLDPALGPVIQFAVDAVTHCGECDAGCIGPLEQCTGLLPQQCCNFYQDNECVIECDVAQGFEPDGIDCIKMCALLDSPPNGQVLVPSRTVTSEATYSCQEGFMLIPNEDTRTCTQVTAGAPEWVPSTAPMCQSISVSLVLPGGLLYAESLGSFEACVVLNDTIGSDVTVNLTTVDGTAQAPADYESVAETFIFTPTSTTTMCVDVTINDDGVGEDVETLSILLSSGSDGVTLGRNAQVFLQDPGGFSSIIIGLEQSTYSADEGAERAEVCAVLPAGPAGRRVEADIGVQDLTPEQGVSATDGADYIVPFLGFVILPPATRQCRFFTIVEDALVEADESLIITLESLDAVLVTGDSARLTIIENDGATVSLSASLPTNFTVTEGDSGDDTDVQFCVQLDDVASGLERDIDFLIVPNVRSSAESGDYQTNPTLTIPSLTAVGNSVCHQITIIGDDIAEGDETLAITVSVANSNDVINGSDVVTVTILDNDVVSLAFTDGTPMVAANGTVSVSFNLVNGARARYRCVIRRHTRPRMRIRVPCSEGTFTADLTRGHYNVLVACRALGVPDRLSIQRRIFVP